MVNKKVKDKIKHEQVETKGHKNGQVSNNNFSLTGSASCGL